LAAAVQQSGTSTGARQGQSRGGQRGRALASRASQAQERPPAPASCCLAALLSGRRPGAGAKVQLRWAAAQAVGRRQAASRSRVASVRRPGSREA